VARVPGCSAGLQLQRDLVGRFGDLHAGQLLVLISWAGAVSRLALLEGFQKLPVPLGQLGDPDRDPLGPFLNAITSHTPIPPATDRPTRDPGPVGCRPFVHH
jgi:hypothetical protein